MAIEVSKLNLDCRKCTKEEKKWRGCEGGAKQPYVIDGEESEFCPVRLINPMTYKYLDMYHYYKQGWLPFGGTILTQPAKLLDLFKIIEKELNRGNK